MRAGYIYHHWTTTEQKFLIANYLTKTVQWIADTLDINASAVKNRARLLKLRKRCSLPKK